MNRFLYRTVLLIFIVLVSASFSQNRAQQQNSERQFVALPFAFYTPETGVAVGVGSILTRRSPNDSLGGKPSGFRVGLTYTQNKQIILSLTPELFSKDESVIFRGEYIISRYPNKYWGIGNASADMDEELFEPDIVHAISKYHRRIRQNLYIGLLQQFEYMKIREVADDGVLRFKQIPGSENGKAIGLGYLINYDSRDHLFYPNKGQFHNISHVFFHKNIFSDYNFTNLTADLRFFLPLGKSRIFALQSYNVLINGSPPFHLNALLGGPFWMRGYFQGRYRDKNMLSFQGELRMPLAWRFGMTVFAGMGDVNGKVSNFRFDELKQSFGFGLRFKFNQAEKINARLDFGFGSDGTSGFYATILEAF